MYRFLLSASMIFSSISACWAQTFAYTPFVLIDLDREIEKTFNSVERRIVRCDTTILWCLNGNYVKLVWPKVEKTYAVGQSFEAAGLKSTVVSVGKVAGHLDSLTAYYLVTDGQSDAVYGVIGGCVFSIILRSSQRFNLAGSARDGSLARAIESGKLATSDALENRIMSYDAPGGCSSPKAKRTLSNAIN